MRLARRQRGMTFWGLTYVAVTLGFIIFVVLKSFSIVNEGLKIDTALKGLSNEPTLMEMGKQDIARALVRRLTINDVSRINETNWKDYLEINKSKEGVEVIIRYEAKAPLFKNVSMAIDYEKIMTK